MSLFELRKSLTRLRNELGQQHGKLDPEEIEEVLAQIRSLESEAGELEFMSGFSSLDELEDFLELKGAKCSG